jgi:hypothetical protein
MRSSLFAAVAVVTLAAPAWATGERVIVTAAAEPFRETICVSMTCVSSGAREAVVSARAVKEGVEVTVKSASGQVKLVHVTPRTEDGSLSSIDVVTASTLVVKAIETVKPLTKPAPKTARAISTSAKLRMLAHR